MAHTIEPPIIDNLGDLPLIGPLFSGAPFGTGIFTAALVLAIMIIPFIAATMRDVFLTVPPSSRNPPTGSAATTWEVMRVIVLPYTRASVVGGIMLGLGRALGETMAVTFVIGNTNRISPSLFGPGNTIASLVALEFPESPAGSLKLSSLLALGLHPVRHLLHRAGHVARPAAAAGCGMSATVTGGPVVTPGRHGLLRRRRVSDRVVTGAVPAGDGGRAAVPGLDPVHAGPAGCRA